MQYNPTEKLLLISELVEANSTYSSHYNLNDMIDLNYKYEYFTLYNNFYIVGYNTSPFKIVYNSYWSDYYWLCPMFKLNYNDILIDKDINDSFFILNPYNCSYKHYFSRELMNYFFKRSSDKGVKSHILSAFDFKDPKIYMKFKNEFLEFYDNFIQKINNYCLENNLLTIKENKNEV